MIILLLGFIPNSYALYGHITRDTTWSDASLVTGDRKITKKLVLLR